PVKRYSSGMFVKLAFSVTAHLDSEIMIMDEVLAVGDVNFQQKCLKKMREVAKHEGRTVLYVSHNMSTIRQLCDRCIVLSQGKVIFEGDVEPAIEVYSNAQKVELTNFYDISGKRRHGAITDKFHMNSIDLITNNVDENTKLRFKLKFDSKEANDKVVFRVVVLNSSDAPVGTTFADELKAVPGENTYEFTLDSTLLGPGTYRADISMLEYRNDIQTRHDAVSGAFYFTVGELVPKYNLKWEPRYYGPVRLTAMDAVNLTDEKE
ncbi:MAG: ABC transporter ATP-binding protein, partial [Clostridia bacterium]|nr:ABC transporter ATP-binding protein [Clostridia bacterium]